MALKKSFIAVAALSATALLGLGTIGATPTTAHAAVSARVHREITGTLQPSFNLVPPSALTVQTAHGLVTVKVSTTTLIVRRYNGDSSLAELSPNDRLDIKGWYQNKTTFWATWIKDQTIQKAFTFMVGKVQTVNGSTVTVTVLRDGRFKHQDPWKLGETITLNLNPNTVIVNANGTAASLSSLQPGMRVAPLGIANRKAHTMTTVNRLRILG